MALVGSRSNRAPGEGLAPTIGRPRAFDTEKALDAALVVFWRHGYDGASLTELTRAMGINRPALYYAFGSKKELFLRALDRYWVVDAVHTFQALRAETAREVTEQYLLRSAEQLTDPARPMGCFVLQGALVAAPENQEIADHMAQLRRTAEQDLCRRYEQAQAEGDLRRDEDPKSLARYVLAVRHGLAVLACSGTTRDELIDVVRRTLDGMRF